MYTAWCCCQKWEFLRSEMESIGVFFVGGGGVTRREVFAWEWEDGEWKLEAFLCVAKPKSVSNRNPLTTQYI